LPVTVLKQFGLATACLFWLAQAAVAKPITVVVISDLNGSYGSTSYAPRINVAIDRIISLQPDLVISTGDMVAGQRKPHLAANQIREMWAAFHEAVSTPLAEAGIPLAVTPGNHDASGYNGFQLEREIYADEWQNRKPALHYIDDSGYPFFYAFELGGARFISLDATVAGPLIGGQMERLDLLTGADSRVEVVFGHLPLWAVAQNREREIIGDRLLAKLFQKNSVSMLLSGHHHAYYPGMDDGIAYIAQACLGGGARKLIGDQARSGQSFTVIEIGNDGQFEVYALAAPDFTRQIDTSSLPLQIVTPGATLLRLDLAR